MTDSLPNPVEQAAELNKLFIEAGWRIRIQIKHPDERNWEAHFANSNLDAVIGCDFDAIIYLLLGFHACICIAIEEAPDEKE